MGKIASAAIAAVALSLGAGTADASVQVLGKSMAASCSDAAFAYKSDPDSIQTCSRAIEQESMVTRDRAATHINRGVLLMRRQNFQAALSDFQAAAKIAPTLGEAYANRGSVYIVEGRFPEAVADFDQALTLGLSQPERTYFNRAVAREWMDDASGAYRDYRKAAELNPKWPDPQEQMVRFTVIKR